MKNISKEEVQELLTIIPQNYPSLDIFHLTNSCNGLCKELYEFCQSQGYQYDLLIPDTEYFEHISQTTEFKPHKFDFQRNRYNRLSRLYDFIFISLNLEEIEDIDTFYKKLYPISKNAGTVIFIVDNETDLRKFEDTLIEKNYVAVNPIMDTFENYQILSAQKMHGWGN
jgi:hypothetical protein